MPSEILNSAILFNVNFCMARIQIEFFGGLDLEMLDSARWMGAEIANQAIANGDSKIEELDDKIRRILRIIEQSGAFEHPYLADDLWWA